MGLISSEFAQVQEFDLKYWMTNMNAEYRRSGWQTREGTHASVTFDYDNVRNTAQGMTLAWYEARMMYVESCFDRSLAVLSLFSQLRIIS